MSLGSATPEVDSLCLIKTLNNLTCKGNNSASSEEGSLAGTVAVAILTSLLSLLIVVGNGLIIVSVTIVKKLRQPANYMIVSLAVSDFLVGFIVLPLTIVYDIGEEWVFGSMMCDVHLSFDVICCTASIMNLCMISIDRYLMITKPLTYPKRRKGKLMAILIAIAWLIPCLIIIPALFGFTENVKNGPSWLRLQNSDICEESGRLFLSPSEDTDLFWNETYNASAAIDGNSTTFWDPGRTSREPSSWYFTLDLGQNYKLSKIGFENAGDNIHDVLKFNIEADICEDGVDARINQAFLVKNGTETLQEGYINDDSEVRYLKMSVNQTFSNSEPQIREFSIYGEKTRGKSCLISQEVWFTIYSTVGAFYLPLTVMLCMYWKIYLEASRFKARHKTRQPNAVESQDWSYSPSASPESPVSGSPSSTSRAFFRRAKHINNSLKNTIDISRKKQEKHKDESSSDSSEHLLPNGCLKSNGIKVVVVDSSEEEKNNHSNFDEDTVSSECEFLPNENAEHFLKTTACADRSCVETNGKGVNDINEDLNGNHKQYELQCSSLPNRALLHNKLGVSDSLSPPASDSNCSSIKPVSILRTWSESSMSRTVEIASARRQRLSFNGVTRNEWRYPTISENTVLNLDHNKFPGKVDFDQLTLESSPRPTYTRSSSIERNPSESTNLASCNLRGPRRSIFFGPVICCTKSHCRRSATSLSQKYPSQIPFKEFPTQRRSSNDTQASLPLKNGHMDANFSGRRSSVFNQIKRRVSMATSRERMRNVKATRTLGIIVGAFAFCWLPFFTVTFLRPFICENPESQDCIPFWLIRLVLWLGYLNSALNPLIYIGFSPDLRETFRFLLICKCTNVDRRLAQTELRQAITRERRSSSISRCGAHESIM